MTTTIVPAQFSFSSLANLRQIVGLISNLGSLERPLTPDGLKQALEIVIQLANLIGVDPAWSGRVQAILDDPRVFNIVLAIVQYLSGLAQPATNAAVSSQTVVVDEQSFSQWLPIVVEIVGLLQQIRGTP
jgi:hypothetical protein